MTEYQRAKPNLQVSSPFFFSNEWKMSTWLAAKTSLCNSKSLKMNMNTFISYVHYSACDNNHVKLETAEPIAARTIENRHTGTLNYRQDDTGKRSVDMDDRFIDFGFHLSMFRKCRCLHFQRANPGDHFRVAVECPWKFQIPIGLAVNFFQMTNWQINHYYYLYASRKYPTTARTTSV
jgi:hypothetical protein